MPIRIAHKHKEKLSAAIVLGVAGLGRTELRHASISLELRGRSICVPRPHWVDGDAGYPGQGLAKSSLCGSHPAWLCLSGTVLVHTCPQTQTLDTRFNVNIKLRMHVPVHLKKKNKDNVLFFTCCCRVLLI